MKKFEYKLLDANDSVFKGLDYQKLHEQLNHFGILGWEVVSTVSVTASGGLTDHLLVTLKRELPG